MKLLYRVATSGLHFAAAHLNSSAAILPAERKVKMSAFNFDGKCQFGNHGEPFLWHGSDNDDISIAMIELMQLAELDEKLALEIADEISACLSSRRTSDALDTPSAVSNVVAESDGVPVI
jgi:hypothetical protein